MIAGVYRYCDAIYASC